jgi:uroporphyrinogen decarboxylase
MKPKERVLTTLEHREPDRVPLDECFRLDLWKTLRSFFGVKQNHHAMKKLGIDIYNVYMNPPTKFMKKAVTLSMMPWNPVIPLEGGLYKDEWGTIYKLGTTGDFFHIVSPPLQDVDSLDSYAFPDVNADGRFDEAERLTKRLNEEFAVAAYMQMTLFEKAAQYLRGFNKFVHDLYVNPRFANGLLDKLLQFRTEEGKRFVEMGVDIVKLGDDIGTQTGMMINPDIWRKYFKPRMKILIKKLKKKSVYVYYHSDGDIRQVIPDLIEIGVDIVNPIQPDCMDPAEIKRLYGDKLTLHGTISVQETLPFGSEEDVTSEVKKRIKECGYGGGFIIAPSNRITPDVPLKNVLTLYEATKRFGIYYPLNLDKYARQQNSSGNIQ